MATQLGSSSNKQTRDHAAAALATDGEPAAEQRDYFWPGKFDSDKIGSGFSTQFQGVDHYDKRSLPNLLTLLGFLVPDDQVTDLRWMAYILATAYWETSHIESAAGKKYWVTMKPVEETGHGAGRAYYLPVKLKVLDSGSVVLTE